MKPLTELTASMERQREATGFVSVLRCRLLNEPVDQIVDTLPTRLRAAVSVGDLTALRNNPTFTDAVLHDAVVGKLLDLATSATVGVPVLHAPDSLTLADVSEGQPVPASAFSVNAAPLPPKKYGTILVFDRRALVSPAPRVRQQFEQALRQAASRGLDAAVLAALTASAPVVVGGLPELVAAVDPLRPVFLASLSSLATLATDPATSDAFANVSTSGTLWSAPVFVAPAVGNKLVLIDAADLVMAFDGLEFDPGPAASLQMDDSPTNAAAPTPVGTTLVSMWQTNSIALRIQAFVSWDTVTANASAAIDVTGA